MGSTGGSSKLKNVSRLKLGKAFRNAGTKGVQAFLSVFVVRLPAPAVLYTIGRMIMIGVPSITVLLSIPKLGFEQAS